MNDLYDNQEDIIIIDLATQLINADPKSFKDQMKNLSEKELIDIITKDGASQKQISEIVQKRRILVSKSRIK